MFQLMKSKINIIFIIFTFSLNFLQYLECPTNSYIKKKIDIPRRNLKDEIPKRKRKIRIFIDNTYMKSQTTENIH